MFCKTPPRQKQNKGSGGNKSQTSKHASVFQNVNQAAAKQTYFTLWLAAEPKQVMCLVAYVYPQDNLIRLSPQPCFILDEFLILLPGKSTAIRQANNNSRISHLSFRQVTQAATHYQRLVRRLLYWKKKNVY